MERLVEDEIFCIYERITDQGHKKSFSLVCKKFLKVACFHLWSLHSKSPDLLFDILIASPKMNTFKCHEPFSNNHMKMIAESCPNLKHLDLSFRKNPDQKVGKLEFDDVGLCAIANACIHLDCVDLSGRLGFREIGIGSLVRSCQNLTTLILGNCVTVTDKSLKMIREATCLETLDLRGCYMISDLGLEYLANGKLKHCLRTLHLDKCDRITDNGIIYLKKLVSLRTLGLSWCGDNITNYGVVALCELPNLEILYLNYLTNITDISLLEIGRKCLNLLRIDLTGCQTITSVGLRGFCGHQSLSALRMFSCYQLSWKDVKAIAKSCPNLRYLYLSRVIKKRMPLSLYEDIEINNHHCRILWE